MALSRSVLRIVFLAGLLCACTLGLATDGVAPDGEAEHAEASAGPAEAAEADTAPAVDLPSPVELPVEQVRDPFTPSLQLEKAAARTIGGERPGRQALPAIRLRGYAEADAEAIALIEIEGHGSIIVREGEQISLSMRQGTASLRVAEITQHAVHLEVEPHGDVLNIR